METRKSGGRRPSCAFAVRTGGIERRVTREELLREIESGLLPESTEVSSIEFFGGEGWRPLVETALWRICHPTKLNSTVLVPTGAAGRLDLVPTSIPAMVCADAGVDEEYMLAMCRDHSITHRQMYHLVGMRTCFETNVATLHRLLDSGLSVDEIEAIYEAREELGRDSGVSLERLVEFYRAFYDGTGIPGAHMAGVIRDAHVLLNPEGFVDSTLKRLCRVAQGTGIIDPGVVVREIVLRSGSED